MPILNQDFEHLDGRYRVVGDYFDPAEPDVDRGSQTEREVQTTLEMVQDIWKSFLDLGFATIGLPELGSRTAYRVVFDDSFGSNGEANNAFMTIGLGSLRNSQSASTLSDRNKSAAEFRALIIHELFHGFTYASAPPFLTMPSFVEGTADAAKVLMLDPNERELIGVPSFEVYMDNPDVPMFDRIKPGTNTSSQSTPTLWWLYFVSRLVPPSSDIRDSIEALRLMFDEEWPEGMRFAPKYRLFGVFDLTARSFTKLTGDFLGNRQDHIAYIALNGLGVVNPTQTYGGHGQAHSVTPAGSRFSFRGWRVSARDRLFCTGDLLGNGRDQIVIGALAPFHLGVLGFDESDGHWRRIRTRTYDSAPQGARWGGWKLREGDQCHVAGRIARSDRDHVVVTSIRAEESAHIGLLGFNVERDSTRSRESLAIRRSGSELGAGGWVFRESDRIVAVGKFLTDADTEQFVIVRSDGSSIGIVGVDDRDQFFTLAVVEEGDRFGRGWKMNRGDTVEGVGRLVPGTSGIGLSQIVIKSQSGILGIVGIGEDGATVTHDVFSHGGVIGRSAPTQDMRDLAWDYSRSNQVVAIGRFLPGDLDAFILTDGMGAAIIQYQTNGQIATVDNSLKRRNATSSNDPQPVTSAEAVGRFSISDRDAVIGTHQGSSWFSMTHFVDDSITSRGIWREAVIGVRKDDPVFSSTLVQLEQVIRTSEIADDLGTVWRDFTVANVGKDLTDAPSQFSYNFQLPGNTKEVARQANFNGSDPLRITVRRWAANYVDVPAGTQRILGNVENANFPIFWSVIVSDRAKKYIRHILDEGNESVLPVMLQADEFAVLVLTTQFSDVDVSLSLE